MNGGGTGSGNGASPRHDVCVVGSFMADILVRAPRRPELGETVVGSSCETFLGGKGFNQAIAAARVGARTAMVGALGDDEHGRQFVALLDRERIDRTGVVRVAGAGTGMAFPVVDDSGENSIIVVPRANHVLSVDDIDRVGEAVRSARVVLLQLEIPSDVALAAAAAARASGAIVVLNPAPAIVEPARFAGLVDVVVPNESELMSLCGTDGDDPSAGARLLAGVTGARGVVVTLGNRGVLVLTGDEVALVPPHQVAAVDTVGAGDAFCGVLAAELAAGIELIDAVRLANAAGALATTRAGAEPAMPQRDHVERLLAVDMPEASTP